MHSLPDIECHARHQGPSFVADVYVVERLASQIVQMKSETIPVGIQSPAKQSATLEHMSNAVSGRFVKLHRRGQLWQGCFSSTLLTDELEDVDGAIQHLHFVVRFLRAFDRTLHHAKLTIAKIADVDLCYICRERRRLRQFRNTEEENTYFPS